MIEMTKTVERIFQLNSSIEHIFFKDFMQKYDMPSGLNSTHMRTMLTLNYRGACPMSDISHILTLEKGSFTPVANKLIKLGFISKEQSETDRRVYNLSLTPEGREVALAFGKEHLAYMEDLLASINKSDQENFNHCVEGILNILSKIPGKELPQFPPKGPINNPCK